LRDWGWHAVQGRSGVLPGSQRRVFVLDSGVAHHEDLSSVVQRVNVDPGSGAERVVGCYGHATHVAGIIGATSGNQRGRVGIYPGVQIISVTVGPIVPQTSPFVEHGVSDCVWHDPSSANEARLTVAQVGWMLDYVFWQTIVWGQGAANMAIVNLSANDLQTGAVAQSPASPTNHTKVQTLLQPTYLWPGWRPWYASGAVFVQSAGNDRQDSCFQRYVGGVNQSPAYVPTANATAADPLDGALVVGAMDRFGQAAATNPTNGWATGFFSTQHPDMQTWQGAFQHSGTSGTAWGHCIDLWAPGDFIYSTWGRNVYKTKQSEWYSGGQPPAYPFNANAPAGPADAYPGWAWLSGTSMAAPHVAAAAAYVADLYGLQSPAMVEYYLRTFHSQWINGLRVPRLQ
jgi:subtilisin family serine protease